jgi:hypothetical protein
MYPKTGPRGHSGPSLHACATHEGASDPSPGPLRLMKTPAAVHPLPKGEGCLIPSLSSLLF